MKRILLVLAFITVGMVSCKKEEGIKPAQTSNILIDEDGGGATKDMGGWD